MRHAYSFFIGELERKKPFGRHRCEWEDYIGMIHREIRWEDVDWIYLAQVRDQW